MGDEYVLDPHLSFGLARKGPAAAWNRQCGSVPVGAGSCQRAPRRGYNLHAVTSPLRARIKHLLKGFIYLTTIYILKAHARKALPEPQDVPCSVIVAPQNQPAVGTVVRPLRQSFGNIPTAPRTELTCTA